MARTPGAASPAPSATVAATPTPQAPGQRLEPALPEPRQEVASAATGDRLYVLGGFDAAGAGRAETFVFDGDHWSAGPRLPLPLDHAAAAVLDGRLYVAGGYSAGRASRRSFRLDGDRWSELAPLARARGALALVAGPAELYALAGADGADVGPAEAYSPATGSWRTLDALPHPRNHVAGFAFQGLACAAGGRSPNVATVDCWDPVAGRWTPLPPLPAPTSGAGGGSLEGVPVVAGGEDPAETRLVDQLAVLRAGAWSAQPMLLPRHGLQLAAFHGRLWACGGADRPGVHAVTACTSIVP